MIKISYKVVKLLSKKRLNISFAESCTGGLLSSKLTKLSGSSKYFKMGLITYSNNAKINILNVKKKLIDRYGAVSQECCRSMVENLSKLSKSKIKHRGFRSYRAGQEKVRRLVNCI